MLSGSGEVGTLNASGRVNLTTIEDIGLSILNHSSMTFKDSGDNNGDGLLAATECSLYWCINNYSAVTNNTIFTETLHDSWWNSSYPFGNLLEFGFNNDDDQTFSGIGQMIYPYDILNITPPTGSAKSSPNIMLTEATIAALDPLKAQVLDEEYYWVSNQGKWTEWLEPLFTGNYSSGHQYGPLASDVLQLLARDPGGVPAVFDRLAQQLNIVLRPASANPNFDPGMAQALGVMFVNETIIKVRWAWLSLPCALLAATMLFLGMTIVGSAHGRVGIWKSSTLPLLYHGLDDAGSGGGGERSNHIVEMQGTARKTWVRLVDEGHGGKLVERNG